MPTTGHQASNVVVIVVCHFNINTGIVPQSVVMNMNYIDTYVSHHFDDDNIENQLEFDTYLGIYTFFELRMRRWSVVCCSVAGVAGLA